MAEKKIFKNDVDVEGDLTIKDILLLGQPVQSGTEREIEAAGGGPDIGINLKTKGTGIVQVPTGYEAYISANDRALVNYGYFKANILGLQASALAQAPTASQDQYALLYDHATTKWDLKAVALANTYTDGLTKTGLTVRLGGDIDEALTDIKQTAVGDIYIRASMGTGPSGLRVYTAANNDNRSELYYGSTIKVAMSADDFTITANVTGSMKYASDYSGLFTSDRSIPDRGWINTHIGGKLVTSLVTGPTGVEDGWVLYWDNVAGRYSLRVSPATSFLGLSDTPNAYAGQAGKVVAVKGDESGLEFITGGGGGSGHTIYSGVSGTPLTTRSNLRFQNGLSAVDANPDTVAKLGGPLVENTNISLATYDFSIETDLFFIDQSTGRIGIGTSSPEATFSVRSQGTNNTRGILLEHSDNTTAFSHAKYIGSRSRGSHGSPTAVQNNDSLVSFSARGYKATGWSNTVGGIYVFAAENWSDTATGTYITLRGVNTTGTTVSQWLRVDQTGAIYPSDLSAGYTSRHLIDKGYADTTYAPIASTAFWKVTGTTTLTANVTIDGNFDKYFTGTGSFVIGHNAVTGSTRLQVRGIGTTTGTLMLLEDSSGTERFKILDNGTTTFTGFSTTGGQFTFNADTGTDSAERELFSIYKKWSGGGAPNANNSGRIGFYLPNDALVDKSALEFTWGISVAAGTESTVFRALGLSNGTRTQFLRIFNQGIAIGYDSQITAAEDIAIGSSSRGNNTGSLALGYRAGNTSGTVGSTPISIGYNANQGTHNIGADSIAIGRATRSTGIGSIAIGQQSYSKGNYSLAYGYLSTASNQDDFVFGYNSSTVDIGGAGANVIIGNSSSISRYQTVVVGVGSVSLGAVDVLIGYQAKGSIAAGYGTVAIGGLANNTSGTLPNVGVSIGYHANYGTYNIGDGSVAIGTESISKSLYSVSVGALAGNTSGTVGSYAISLGYNANQGNHNIGADSIAIGRATKTTHTNSIAIGQSSQAGGNDSFPSISIGYLALANSDTGIAIGQQAKAGGSGNISIGYFTGTTSGTVGIRAINIGLSTNAGSLNIGDRSIAIGDTVVTTGSNSIAIGYLTEAKGTNEVVIGASSGSTGGTHGIFSTSIGPGANYSATSKNIGAYSIAIGRLINTTASGSIILGYGSTSLENSTADSFALGWNEDTPTILFAKSTTSYFNSTSGIVFGSNSITANTKFDIRGFGTTTNTILRLANSANSSRFRFTDAGLMYIDVTPANDDALTQVLVRDSGTGEVKYRTASSLGGGSGYTTASITSATHNETATSGHKVLLVDTTSNSITVNLPACSGNTAMLTIKRVSGGSNTLTIDGNLSETIDGNATESLSFQYQSITLVTNGTNWFII